MTDSMLLDDLRANHAAIGREESIYSRASAEIERLVLENEKLRQLKPIELRADAKAYAKRMQGQVDALYAGLLQIELIAERIRPVTAERAKILATFHRTMQRVVKKEIQG